MIAGFLLIVILVCIVVEKRRMARRKLPPGPIGHPVIGNVFDVPQQSPWMTFRRWSQEYESDIISMNLMGSSVIVLNSAKAVEDLMSKRSAIYSDRPHSVMMHELTRWDLSFGLMGYGAEWKTHRRTFQQYFNARKVHDYEAEIANNTVSLLKRVLDSPQDFLHHIRWASSSLILKITYGLEAKDMDNLYLRNTCKALHGLELMCKAGAFLVDAFPLLKHIPAWFPGTAFKKQAKQWRAFTEDMYTLPLNAVMRDLSQGVQNDSVVSSLLSKTDSQENKVEHQQIVTIVAGTSIAAGQDTGISSISFFCLAMLLYPSIQKSAQSEIDRVIGTERLPDFTDLDSLPLITAIMWEVLRWHPLAPMGLPHRVMEDDEYQGYHIPAGSVVWGNIWAISHDPETYPEPEKFNPYRYLTADGKFNNDAPLPETSFGFGRRVCPGRDLAFKIIWLNIARILATVSIEPAVDEHGRTIEPRDECTDDLISFPKPFLASLKPRSSAVAELIHNAELVHKCK